MQKSKPISLRAKEIVSYYTSLNSVLEGLERFEELISANTYKKAAPYIEEAANQLVTVIQLVGAAKDRIHSIDIAAAKANATSGGNYGSDKPAR